jgi:seryl-tRNA synthetase
MLDIAFIREQPQKVKAGLESLGADPTVVDEIVALDVRRRELLTEVEELRAERNRVSKQIGRLRDQAEREPLITAMREVGDRIGGLEEQLRQVEADLQTAMLAVPNLPHESVPYGPDDTHNVVVGQWGL